MYSIVFTHIPNLRYADDNLNRVAAELDSFDGRKDPERCAALVSRLRSCQDKLLNICNRCDGDKHTSAFRHIRRIIVI